LISVGPSCASRARDISSGEDHAAKASAIIKSVADFLIFCSLSSAVFGFVIGMFDKIQRVAPGAIVDNKRLRAALAFVWER
jgi:hypothetical protein